MISELYKLDQKELRQFCQIKKDLTMNKSKI